MKCRIRQSDLPTFGKAHRKAYPVAMLIKITERGCPEGASPFCVGKGGNDVLPLELAEKEDDRKGLEGRRRLPSCSEPWTVVCGESMRRRPRGSTEGGEKGDESRLAFKDVFPFLRHLLLQGSAASEKKRIVIDNAPGNFPLLWYAKREFRRAAGLF